MSCKDKINLYFNNGKAYVWNDQDWLTLRQDHRIVGFLVGTSPALPKQDNTGLPMQLMPEEACLLVENNIARLVRHIPGLAPETEELYRTVKESSYKEQITLMRNERKIQIQNQLDKIIEGKKKKLAAQGLSVNEESFNKETLMEKELDKLEPLSIENSFIELFTENPLKLQTELKEVPLEELSDLCSIKRRIFRDLWEKGSYITGGEKFGGHFLVYPGDPHQVHSSHIVYVCPRNEPIRMTELIIIGRVAVNVKKKAMYATISENGEVKYQTLQWKGC